MEVGMTVKEKWINTAFHKVEIDALDNVVEFIVGALKDRLIEVKVTYEDDSVIINVGKEYDC
jgi:hypothetical protein